MCVRILLWLEKSPQWNRHVNEKILKGVWDLKVDRSEIAM